MAEVSVRIHVPSNRRATPAVGVFGAFRTIEAAFAGLRSWLVAGRRYQPERWYMRGGQPRADGGAGAALNGGVVARRDENRPRRAT